MVPVGFPVGPLTDEERADARRRLDEATAVLGVSVRTVECGRCGSTEDVVFIEKLPGGTVARCGVCRGSDD